MHSRCPWDYPQAFYLQMAAMVAGTDWVWIVDIDDLPFTDGLSGLDEVRQTCGSSATSRAKATSTYRHNSPPPNI
jgi:hypothetical protein